MAEKRSDRSKKVKWSPPRGKRIKLTQRRPANLVKQREAVERLRQLNEELDRRVAERTEAIELLYDVASMANSAQNVRMAMAFCLDRLTHYNGWRFGHALNPVDGGDRMALASHCYPDGAKRFREFRKATEKSKFTCGERLIGRVLATRAPVWITDLPGQLAGDRSVAADKLGLATAVAFPVLVGEKVAAVLEFFSELAIPIDHRIINIMAGVGMQLGRVIERANLQEHLLKIADQMQQRVAQDLHDDVGQELTGLSLKAETLAEALKPGDTRRGKLAADVAANVNRVQGKVRGLARRILPIEIELNSLPGALKRLAEETSVGSSAACAFHCDHAELMFEPPVAAQLYRIAQESVANAIRHGHARNIRIDLVGENGGTQLCVSDDGRGMPAAGVSTDGLGMRIMRYRASLVGGALHIRTASGGGTAVTCVVPAARTDQTPR
jgi:signal transduction histidine kinase